MEDVDKEINKINIQLGNLRDQVRRLVSDAESEKGTRSRISNLIFKTIEKLEKDIKDILYGIDRKSGMVVDVDRMNQYINHQKATRASLYGLWIGVALLIIERVVNFLIKR